MQRRGLSACGGDPFQVGELEEAAKSPEMRRCIEKAPWMAQDSLGQGFKQQDQVETTYRGCAFSNPQSRIPRKSRAAN
jgi:hypothetical protein